MFFKQTMISMALVALSACASTALKGIRRVEVGMDKADVLELVGSPRRSTRVNGRDQWTYIYYDDDRELGTVVQFEKGRVVYVRPARLTSEAIAKADEFPSFEEYDRAVKERPKKAPDEWIDVD